VGAVRGGKLQVLVQGRYPPFPAGGGRRAKRLRPKRVQALRDLHYARIPKSATLTVTGFASMQPGRSSPAP
jgi:hypothetical protein